MSSDPWIIDLLVVGGVDEGELVACYPDNLVRPGVTVLIHRWDIRRFHFTSEKAVAHLPRAAQMDRVILPLIAIGSEHVESLIGEVSVVEIIDLNAVWQVLEACGRIPSANQSLLVGEIFLRGVNGCGGFRATVVCMPMRWIEKRERVKSDGASYAEKENDDWPDPCRLYLGKLPVKLPKEHVHDAER